MILWKLHELCSAILTFWAVVVQAVDGAVLPSTGPQLLWKGSIPTYRSRKNVHLHRAIGSERGEEESYVMGRHSISWYPGHIAKAEKDMKDFLKAVDVVVEVRDSRTPRSTTHPMIPTWIGHRPLIVVFNRADMTPDCALRDWRRKKYGNYRKCKKYLRSALCELQDGIRVAVLGYPNVGKSALINRLAGRRMAPSRNIPGVTRKMSWIRLSGKSERVEKQLEMLDSPGLIPPRISDPDSALMLAICNNIGMASYDNQVVAAAMMEKFLEVANQCPGYVDLKVIEDQYGIDPRKHTGEEFLCLSGKNLYRGELNSMANRLLVDFRKGALGNIALEPPPPLPKRRDSEEESRNRKNKDFVVGIANGEEGFSYPTGNSTDAAQTFAGIGNYEGW